MFIFSILRKIFDNVDVEDGDSIFFDIDIPTKNGDKSIETLFHEKIDIIL